MKKLQWPWFRCLSTLQRKTGKKRICLGRSLEQEQNPTGVSLKQIDRAGIERWIKLEKRNGWKHTQQNTAKVNRKEHTIVTRFLRPHGGSTGGTYSIFKLQTPLPNPKIHRSWTPDTSIQRPTHSLNPTKFGDYHTTGWLAHHDPAS
jgi:hypothetical protein